MKDFKISIGGDLVITEGYNPELDKEITSLFKANYCDTVNLEFPMIMLDKTIKYLK